MSISHSNLSAFRSRAFLGLGSNMRDPAMQIQRALREIDELPEVALIRVSSLYASAPVGKLDQADFINAVAEIETTQSPQALMQLLLGVETSHERVREEKNGPRTLDLDVLLFNDWVLSESALSVPHPRMHERAFVLLPLVELAPDIHIPGIGAASSLLPQLSAQIVRRIDASNVDEIAARMPSPRE